MSEAAIVFTPDGRGHALYTEAVDLSAIGALAVRRATTIEFDDDNQYWRVRDDGGFPLFNSPSRRACLEWERRHLEDLETIKHGGER